MRIRVDRQRCCGHTLCHIQAPDVYPLDDDGYNALEGEVNVPSDLAEAALRGAQSCPEQAIEVVER